MVKPKEVKVNRYFLIEKFILVKKYKKSIKTMRYDGSIGYENFYFVHEGCYKKIETIKFQNEKELYNFIKNIWKIKNLNNFNGVELYPSLKMTLKINKNYENIIFTLKEIGQENTIVRKNNLKKKIKKPSKKVYYCDCYYCTKTTKENKEKILIRDEKIINNM